jgi:hypothetical protein
MQHLCSYVVLPLKGCHLVEAACMFTDVSSPNPKMLTSSTMLYDLPYARQGTRTPNCRKWPALSPWSCRMHMTPEKPWPFSATNSRPHCKTASDEMKIGKHLLQPTFPRIWKTFNRLVDVRSVHHNGNCLWFTKIAHHMLQVWVPSMKCTPTRPRAEIAEIYPSENG